MAEINWTHEKPTEPGYYVWRVAAGAGVPHSLALIYEFPGYGLTVRWLHGGANYQDTLLADVTGREWLAVPP